MLELDVRVASQCLFTCNDDKCAVTVSHTFDGHTDEAHHKTTATLELHGRKRQEEVHKERGGIFC